MTTFWSETWTGTTSGPWPSGWSSSLPAATTIVSNRGRITAGPGSYNTVRARLERMADQRDTNLLITFTVNTNIEWYVSLGVRTASNDPGGDPAFATRGVYARIGSLLGNFVDFWNDNGAGTATKIATTSLPAFTIGATYRARFRAQGSRLRVRVWNAAGAEPATWALDITDTQVHQAAGKVVVAFGTNVWGDVQYLDVDDLQVAGLDPVRPAAAPRPRHVWTMWSRAANYSPDVTLPIASIKVVRRWLGVSTAIIETGYTPLRWESLQSSRGVVMYRDGEQEFTGLVAAREQTWDAKTGQLRIRVEAVGDEQHLADRLVFPDPMRAADDQTVNDHWMTRTSGGVPVDKKASTAMWQLISDQAGPTCWPPRQVPGLVMGADPGVGLSRTWSGLFNSAGDRGVLDQLTDISIVSGENLGVRCTSATGSLTFDIVQPRDLGDAVRFSADLRNLVGYSYREQAPSCTDGLAAGQGDLHARLREHVTTASAVALSWGRQIWKYIDRRDTADATELTKAATDAVTEGDAKVSLAVTLTDSQAATYRRDWDLGDVITVYVAPPGQENSVTVTDVVREILLEVDDKGVERLTPAIGTPDATALPRSATQQQLEAVGTELAGLKARK